MSKFIIYFMLLPTMFFTVYVYADTFSGILYYKETSHAPDTMGKTLKSTHVSVFDIKGAEVKTNDHGQFHIKHEKIKYAKPILIRIEGTVRNKDGEELVLSIPSGGKTTVHNGGYKSFTMITRKRWAYENAVEFKTAVRKYGSFDRAISVLSLTKEKPREDVIADLAASSHFIKSQAGWSDKKSGVYAHEIIKELSKNESSRNLAIAEIKKFGETEDFVGSAAFAFSLTADSGNENRSTLANKLGGYSGAIISQPNGVSASTLEQARNISSGLKAGNYNLQ